MSDMSNIKKFVYDESGATMVEYVILVGLVAIAALAAITAFGSTVSSTFTSINSSLTSSALPSSGG